ncbi:MAG: DNA-processing protein DprA [Opitutales bacterium]
MSPVDAETRDLLALHLVPGLGPRLTAALLERFGSAGGALQAAADQLRQVPHIGPKLSEELCRAMRTVDVEAELALIAKHGVHLRRLGQPGYPASLAEIPDPPHLLYVRGSLEPTDAKAVAIVGSRQYTGYGRRLAERLAAELARAGYTVVSGLARGIDGIAHRAALEAGGRTLAVLAGGLSRIYPPEHTELAGLVAAAGALIGENPMTAEPMPGMFPARNRIISGLSRGVVIIEAGEKSGTLITAEHASQQGRTVFAVPGPVDSPTSVGTNSLIREGAVLVRNAADIIEDLEGIRGAASVPQAPPPELDGLQRQLWDFLGEGARHLDEMAQRLGVAIPQLSGNLLTLEMKRLIRRLPGNRYERC